MKYRYWSGSWFAICLGFAAAWFFVGCQTASKDTRFAPVPGLEPVAEPGAPGHSGAVVVADASGGSADVLSVGDSLVITFSDLPIPQQPLEQKIKDDGTITLLQNQTFVATNKTVAELQKEIRERYVPRIFKQMTATITQQPATRFYYVSGEVKVPARQVYINRITVRQAIASCGDFTDFARRTKVRLTRANGKTQIIDINEVIEKSLVDPEVFPGDKIHVPRKWW